MYDCCQRRTASAAVAQRVLLSLAIVVVLLLGFVTSAPVCGELASNMLTSSDKSWRSPTLAQKFEVTYAVTLTSVSTVFKNPNLTYVPDATINSDSSSLPGSPLTGGSLLSPSSVGTSETNYTVNTAAAGNSDGLYLGKGVYWLVLSSPDSSDSNGFDMPYIPNAINTSMPIVLHDFAMKSGGWTTFIARELFFRASGCNLLPSATPSSSPTASPTSSPSPSPSLSLSPSPTASPSPTRSATPSPLASASPLLSMSASPPASASPSPSPSLSLRSSNPAPSATIVPLVANVTASFDSTTAAEVHVTAPLTSNNNDAKSAVGVSSQFASLVVGNATLPASALTSFTRTVRNETTASGNGTDNTTTTTTTTYIYAGRVDNATQLEQAFTFHATDKSTQFARNNFTIRSGSVKWSVNLTRNDINIANDAGNVSSSESITMKYRLTGLLSTTNSSSSPSAMTKRSAGGMRVRKKSNSPHANMTTYFLSFGRNDDGKEEAGCVVELFDVALVDGSDVPVPISHEINIVPAATASQSSSSSNGEFELALHFPAFERSLVYDPSISLGVLLGGGHDDLAGSGGDDNKTGMIIAVAVSIGVAAAVALAVIVAGTLFIARRRKQARAKFRKSAALSSQGQWSL